jgi:hypothetical protein
MQGMATDYMGAYRDGRGWLSAFGEPGQGPRLVVVAAGPVRELPPGLVDFLDALGPLVGNEVAFTGTHWNFDRGGINVHVSDDFTRLIDAAHRMRRKREDRAREVEIDAEMDAEDAAREAARLN